MTEIDYEKIIRALLRARKELAADLGDSREADLRIQSLVNLTVTAGGSPAFAKLETGSPPEDYN